MLLLPGSDGAVEAETEVLSSELSAEMAVEDIESAEKIKEHMSGKADLIIYGYYPLKKNGDGGREVSNLLFLQENEGNMEIYSLPLENFLSMELARELGQSVNSGRPADRLEASLLYFLDIIDIYGEITVLTPETVHYLDSGEAEDFILQDQGEGLSRLERQELVIWSMLDEVGDSDLPDFTGLAGRLLYAQAQMDTTLNLSEGVMLLLRFMTGIPEDVNFYHPASYEGDSWPSTI